MHTTHNHGSCPMTRHVAHRRHPAHPPTSSPTRKASRTRCPSTPWHTIGTCTAPFTGSGAILEAERYGVRAWVLFLPVSCPQGVADELDEERPLVVTHLPRVALEGSRMVTPQTVACMLRVKGTPTLILRDSDPDVLLALAALLDADRAVALYGEYEQRDTFITIEDRPKLTTGQLAACIFGGKL